MIKHLILASATILSLSACKSTPEPIEEPVIEIKFDPIRNCYPIEILTKVDVPEVTETRIAIVLVDNPPHEPIERREQIEVVVEPARTAYINSEGQEVVDICEPETATVDTAG